MTRFIAYLLESLGQGGLAFLPPMAPYAVGRTVRRTPAARTDRPLPLWEVSVTGRRHAIADLVRSFVV